MQKDLLYCALDVSKDRLDIDGAALALPEQPTAGQPIAAVRDQTDGS